MLHYVQHKQYTRKKAKAGPVHCKSIDWYLCHVPVVQEVELSFIVLAWLRCPEQ
jgi:hypothetical protein